MKETTKVPDPRTLQEAIVYFADPERCFAYAVKLRWPDGMVTCPRCGTENRAGRKFCGGCGAVADVNWKAPASHAPAPDPGRGLPSLSEHSGARLFTHKLARFCPNWMADEPDCGLKFESSLGSVCRLC